jgi:hypothetical protein
MALLRKKHARALFPAVKPPPAGDGVHRVDVIEPIERAVADAEQEACGAGATELEQPVPLLAGGRPSSASAAARSAALLQRRRAGLHVDA